MTLTAETSRCRFACALIMLVSSNLLFFGIVGLALADEKFFNLGLIAYNYSDYHIADYSVDATGGGNVFLSSPSSGGSGTTCCVRVSSSQKESVIVRIRWQFGGCKYVLRNDWTGETLERTHYFFKEKDVRVSLKNSIEPHYFETHFYDDGSVKARVTNSISTPQIIRSANRKDRSSFPRCKNDAKPDA